MSQEETQKVILEILSKYIDEEAFADQVIPDAKLEELGIDSMAVIEIIFDIEEAFDVDMPGFGEVDGSDASLGTVSDLVNIVDSLIEKK
jgi:acyl carrier protein